MHPNQLPKAILPASSLFFCTRHVNTIITEVNILVIFPSCYSYFFVLYSSQNQGPLVAQFKIGGKKL